MAKRLLLSLMLIILVALSALILYRLLRPERPIYAPTEVERVFPGGEVVFVRSGGLKEAWDIFKRSDYYRERGYAPLLTLPVLDGLSRKVAEAEEDIGRDINFDVIMYLLGQESAVGFYTGESGQGRFNYLVVSRVYPEILFMERLATFFAGERYVTESRYRGLKVKEIVVDGDGEEGRDVRKIVYTIDGDLLILTGGDKLFYTAADRHLDGGRGGLSRDERFVSAVEKLNDAGGVGGAPYLFGFIDSRRLRETPIASEALSRIEGHLSCDLLLFNAHIDGGEKGGNNFNPGEIVVGLETRGGKGRGPGGSGGSLSEGGFFEPGIAEDELILVKVHDLSLLPESVFGEASSSEEAFITALLDLFFDGFTAAVVQGEESCPGLVAWGKSPPGVMKIVNEAAEKNGWAVIESEAGGHGFYTVAETAAFGPVLFVFAFHDGVLFAADSADLLTAVIERVEGKRSLRLSLKEAVFSRLGEREGGVSLTARPGSIRESVKACPSGFDLLSARLYRSPEEGAPFFTRFRFIEGLYPVREVKVKLFGVDNGIKAEININIDSDVEGGEAQ